MKMGENNNFFTVISEKIILCVRSSLKNITLVSEAILRPLEAILNENFQKVIGGSDFGNM